MIPTDLRGKRTQRGHEPGARAYKTVLGVGIGDLPDPDAQFVYDPLPSFHIRSDSQQ